MQNFIYPAKIEVDEEGFFLVTFRDLPTAVTDGKTHQESLDNATDCLEEAIAMCIDDGIEVPLPSKQRKGEIGIVLPALMAAKAALYITIRKKGLTKAAFSRLLNVNEKEGRRLLDPHHKTKIPRINEAMSALGNKLVIGMWK
ncbi:MAG: type II toxin-antitoxin system HicB family antitoxin [Deltaproteobacteria bacterium]|jgi:antitoxin HicB|nr:type II toxin-antitoxin system HicB family antitoxin [Deltaproteobacteria bacterium]